VDAILIPQRNAALLLEGEKWRAFITPERIEPRESDADSAAVWLRGAEGAIFLEDITAEETQKHLRRHVLIEYVFRLFLPLFDGTLSNPLRVEIAQKIEQEFSAHGLLANTLGARFYAAPFPSDDRMEAAIDLARTAETTLLRGFLLSLRNHQGLIRRVAAAWDGIPDDCFVDCGPREEIRRTFVEQGVFFRLVDLLATGGSIPRFHYDEDIAWRGERPADFVGLLVQLTRPFFEEATSRWVAPSQLAVLRHQVDGRKDEIMELVRVGKTAQAVESASELAAFQTSFGHARFAAMSLCDLAAQAEKLRATVAQMEFARLATTINPHDMQCWNHLAHAFKENNSPSQALLTYEDVIAQAPRNAVARNGRAEVLRELNRLDEALAAYEQTIELHKDNTVARCGRAEVLRDLNRLDEALAAYEQTIELHKDNVFSRNGRAEVLRDLNRPDEALVAYEQTIELHKDNAVARCGHAEVLRDLNRLDEALAAYEQTIELHKDNAVARNGRAEVLRDLNRLDEALAAYEQTIELHKDNAVARCGRAEVLRDLNWPDEALAAYEQTIELHKDDTVARCGRAEVLRDLNRFDEALAAYDETIELHKDDTVARNGRADLLGRLGRFSEAFESLPIAPHSRADWRGYHLRGMLHLQQGEAGAAREIFRKGLEAILPRKEKAYFQTAFAFACLLDNRPEQALENLKASGDKRLRIAQEVLRSHTLGALGRMEECAATLQPLRVLVVPQVHVVVEEIDFRFLQHAPRHSETWLYQEEAELLYPRAA